MPFGSARIPTVRTPHPEEGSPLARRPDDRVVRHLGADDRSSTRVRLVDGALACLARQGTAKTTVDDIARAAGLSRATLYRTFPGGKDAVLAAVVETEAARFFSALAVTMGEASDLEALLVGAMVTAAQRLSSHEVLRYLFEHEPGVILPQLAFAKMDRVLEVAGDFGAPFFARWLGPDEAARAAEWVARVVVSYVCSPDPGVDLSRPADARRLARAYVLPGILALGVQRPDGPPNAYRRNEGSLALARRATPGPSPRRRARPQRRQGGHER
jgi:AcrR family transcriptional regulator